MPPSPLPLLPIPVLIHLVPDRMEISPLDIRISEVSLLVIPERHYRVVGQDLLLDLLVKRQALALIFHGQSLCQLFVHRWVGVVPQLFAPIWLELNSTSRKSWGSG